MPPEKARGKMEYISRDPKIRQFKSDMRKFMKLSRKYAGLMESRKDSPSALTARAELRGLALTLHSKYYGKEELAKLNEYWNAMEKKADRASIYLVAVPVPFLAFFAIKKIGTGAIVSICTILSGFVVRLTFDSVVRRNYGRHEKAFEEIGKLATEAT